VRTLLLASSSITSTDQLALKIKVDAAANHPNYVLFLNYLLFAQSKSIDLIC